MHALVMPLGKVRSDGLQSIWHPALRLPGRAKKQGLEERGIEPRTFPNHTSAKGT